jgi:steroid delta-isomerase-like uncharacterized protein
VGRAKEIVDQYWHAMETGNVETIRELLTADGVVILPGGARVEGADQLIPLLQGYVDAFPGLRHEVVDYVESGNKIAVELRVTMTHAGPFHAPAGEIPATGRTVIVESVDVIHVDGGKVTSWHTYFDQLAFLQQLGLAPSPEAVPA